jgi:hypothetical protein
MKNLKPYNYIVRYSAVYDIVMTTAFAIPFVQTIQIALLKNIHLSFGLSGSFPEFEPLHIFFTGLLGSLVTVWSVLRIVRPEAQFGLYDSITRFLFAMHMGIALFAFGVTELIWFFIIPETVWGIVQLAGYFMQRDSAMEKRNIEITEQIPVL